LPYWWIGGTIVSLKNIINELKRKTTSSAQTGHFSKEVQRFTHESDPRPLQDVANYCFMEQRVIGRFPSGCFTPLTPASISDDGQNGKLHLTTGSHADAF